MSVFVLTFLLSQLYSYTKQKIYNKDCCWCHSKNLEFRL